MLQRTLEPEVMDDAAEAAAYDAMDHSAVNDAFVADLIAAGWTDQHVLDLGAGTALIPIAMCRANPRGTVTAVDAAVSMLSVARDNVETAGLASRIQLLLVDAKEAPFADGAFELVASNSIIHHIPQPEGVFREAVRVTAEDGLLFFRDLLRPGSVGELDELVQRYAGDESPAARKMFADSLAAALTVAEVQAIVSSLGFAPGGVQATSDRHWTWQARKSA